ncbi:hypothetical protein HQO85_15185 [Rhodococcus fascians]|nr:hypothetical protein [Rhodococcus fascians]
MSESATTFVDACVRGEAFARDIDDWVDTWHDTDFAGSEPSLDEFLGFSDSEGALWVEKPESLSVIVAAHKLGVPVAELLVGQSTYALAARSASPEDAASVLQWLIERGRI